MAFKNINIGKLLLLLLIPVAAISVYILATRDFGNKTCSDVRIKINYKTREPLINEADIYRYLGFKRGKTDIIGKKTSELNLQDMEVKLLKKAVIQSVQIYMGMTGDLIIEIVQRNPILRVIPNGKSGYYLCDDLHHIPFSKQYTPDLIPATGKMDDKIDRILFSVVGFVNNNTFWKDQIQQFFVSDNRDISFVPTIGTHEVILGDTTDLEDKFQKLEIFYRNGLNKIGWNRYHSINLKFKGQVICK